MKQKNQVTDASIKEVVREKYAGVVQGCCGGQAATSCCGDTHGSRVLESGYNMVGESYESIAGHVAEADLGLGCGIPTRLANLAPGETVVDLGSGAGNDAFVARAAVGESGRVIGLDFTEQMIDRARSVATKRGFRNVEFVHGDIEAMPITDAVADIVISNCVLNLVPDKRTAFQEMYRIIKPGGRFCISDIVIDGELPPEVRSSLEAYVGCVGGAIRRERYLNLLRESGFIDVNVGAEHPVDPPDNVLLTIFDEKMIAAYRASGANITSVTVTGIRPDGS